MLSMSERFSWYGINEFICNLGKISQESGGEWNQIVNLGGNSVFCWMLYCFGGKAVTHFRGTDDIDLLANRIGTFDYLLQIMRDRRFVTNWEQYPSQSFDDKCTYKVRTPGKFNPNQIIVVDLYQSNTGIVRFNSREMSCDQVVKDAPVVLGCHVAPSLRDIFFLKMDIISDSRSGLRIKDQDDVLAICVMADSIGQSFLGYINEMVFDSFERGESIYQVKARLDNLKRLFLRPDVKKQIDTKEILGLINKLTNAY